MKIYLDAWFWVNYAWGLVNKTGKVKPSIKKLCGIIETKKIEVITSIFLNTEISAHFRDWYILQKMLKDGHSYRELAKLKKNYNLNVREEKKVNEILQKIYKLSWVKLSELQELDKDSLKVFESLTLQYHMDSIDTLHSIIAANADCKFLITKDEDMRDKMNLFLDDIKYKDFYVCLPDEFLNKVNQVKP